MLAPSTSIQPSAAANSSSDPYAVSLIRYLSSLIPVSLSSAVIVTGMSSLNSLSIGFTMKLIHSVPVIPSLITTTGAVSSTTFAISLSCLFSPHTVQTQYSLPTSVYVASSIVIQFSILCGSIPTVC